MPLSPSQDLLYFCRMANKYCLILGAKSDIGIQLAHIFAKNGWSLYLAARRAEDFLGDDAADIRIRHKVDAQTVEFDALDYDSHQNMYNALPQAPEVVVSMVGFLPEQSDAEQDIALGLKTLAVNYNGCASILSIAANEMEASKRGVIVGVSSVAGDRGRAKNYFYGSAKAGFTAFLSGLRNRLYSKGVHVVTVKPGFVYTRMTKDMELPPRLTATSERVAKDIYKAVRKKKNIIYSTGKWRLIMWIIRNIPEWQFKKMKL